MFTNLRTRYSRDRKKLKQAKVSGSGSDGVSKVKDEAGDMVPYLAWFDPFYKARKTISNRLLQLIQKMRSQKSMNRQIKMIHPQKRKTYLT